VILEKIIAAVTPDTILEDESDKNPKEAIKQIEIFSFYG
jgi:hypothetical protein